MASVHSYSAHVSWAHCLGAAVFRVKVLLPHSQSPPPRALTSVLGASSHIPLICSLFHFTRSFSQASGGVHWSLQCDDLVAWQSFVTTQAFLNDVEIAYVHAFHLNVLIVCAGHTLCLCRTTEATEQCTFVWGAQLLHLSVCFVIIQEILMHLLAWYSRK